MEVSINYGDIFLIFQTIFLTVTQSTTFHFLLFFLGIYTIVLLLDIILLFILRPVGSDLKKGFFGTTERPSASPRVLKKEWEAIESLLSSKRDSEYKVAILKADAFVDTMLSEIGYAGKDLGERIESIRPGHFSQLDSLREAHEIRNRIILDREYSIDQGEAIRVLGLFRLFLEEEEIFS